MNPKELELFEQLDWLRAAHSNLVQVPAGLYATDGVIEALAGLERSIRLTVRGLELAAHLEEEAPS
jgi:hypothetical protein